MILLLTIRRRRLAGVAFMITRCLALLRFRKVGSEKTLACRNPVALPYRRIGAVLLHKIIGQCLLRFHPAAVCYSSCRCAHLLRPFRLLLVCRF